jgi:hypothetical protein
VLVIWCVMRDVRMFSATPAPAPSWNADTLTSWKRDQLACVKVSVLADRTSCVGSYCSVTVTTSPAAGARVSATA